MQASKKTTLRIKLLMAICAIVLTFGMLLPQANAQENPREPAATAAPIGTAPKSAAKRYFVEFRSRSALSYGHTFLVHGKLNANGQVGKVSKDQVAGLHPATDSSIPWMIGHVIPVVSEQGWSDGDNEDEYITAAYRITMTEPEYARVSAYIRDHQKNSPLWHAVLYNCNAWVGDVAKFMGLKSPGNTLLMPEDYIETLAKLNGGIATRPSEKPQRAAKPRPRVAAAKPKPATGAPQTAAPQAAAPQTAATPAAAEAPAAQ
jgi:hypothetical protein